jgi:hypothetical protein
MPKKINITGTCYPALHYMADISAKLKAIMTMVEEGEYFTINRPRQYGKTTMLATLNDTLSARADYLPIRMNFQGVDSKHHETDSAFAQMVLRQMRDFLEHQDRALFDAIQDRSAEVEGMDDLSRLITYMAHQSKKKLVLLIDEVDASSNYWPFLRFLGMLRSKYLDRFSPQNATFYSVVLAGVHDVKSLKSKIRAGEDNVDQYNSPWNIAADFKVTMSLQPEEIVPMLEDFAQKQGVQLDAPYLAERLYYYTSGYPFLVSKLCKIMSEELLPAREGKALAEADLEQAVQQLMQEDNTNFESLIKNLENNPELYNLAFQVIINGVNIPFNPDEPVTALGRLYGIFKSNGRLRIHNRIYEQRLYSYMTAKYFREQLSKEQEVSPGLYTTADGQGLDLERALLRFQQYLREQYSKRDEHFLERHWRLVFLAFLKPIINGKGHDFKKVQISEEKRLDVVVTYHQQKYIIELKRWYGEEAHQRGLLQLADYLQRQGMDKGYLLIFDPRRQGDAPAHGWQEVEGKRVFVVWV